MADHPLIFTGDSVPQIIAGLKTQTRRVISRTNSLVDGRHWTKAQWATLDFGSGRVYVDRGPSPAGNPGPYLHVPSVYDDAIHRDNTMRRVYPRVQTGDTCWIKESWRVLEIGDWDEEGMASVCVAYQAGPRTASHWIELPWREVGGAYDQAMRAEGKGWRSPMFMPRWASRELIQITGLRAEHVQNISKEWVWVYEFRRVV